jgi:hypothetical protein
LPLAGITALRLLLEGGDGTFGQALPLIAPGGRLVWFGQRVSPR